MHNFGDRKILITGSEGFIGKILSEYLVNKGFRVRKMVRNVTSLRYLQPKKEETVYGDLTDLNSLFNATRGVSVVVNLAAKKLDEKNSYHVNVLGSKNLLEACKVNSVKKIIQVSSVSAKIPKKGLYGETKEIADKIISAGKIPFVILRVSLVYGKGVGSIFHTLVKLSKLPVVPVFGNGKWISYPIHVSDLSKAIERAAINDSLQNKYWDVGGDEAISFDNLIKNIASLQRRNPKIIHLPVLIGLMLARILAFFYKKPPITVSNILGSTQNVDMDIKKFYEEFHIKLIPLEKGIREILNNPEDKAIREINILSNYILSLTNIDFKPDPIFIKNYLKVLENNKKLYNDRVSDLIFKLPWLMGPADAILRLYYPRATLIRKLLIVSALLETNTITSDWLMPKKRALHSLLGEFFSISLSIAFKYVLGLMLIPFFIVIRKK